MAYSEPFQSNGLVTGIGSLPLTDPQAAVEFVAETCPEIPFWPQLPQRHPDERMIEQTLYPFLDLLEPRSVPCGYLVKPGRVDRLLDRLEQDPACFNPAAASGFFAFKSALAAGKFNRAVAVKGHVTGPLTLIFQLFIGNDSLWRQQDLAGAVGRYVTRLALWQAGQLAHNHLPVLIFVDEPCLGLFRAKFSRQTKLYSLDILKEVLAELRRAGIITGLHCCVYPALADLNYVQPDIFSFDAFAGLAPFCASSEAKAFLQRGGQVAFGLVPTWADLSPFRPDLQFYRWLLAARPLLDLSDLAQRSLVTATCGLGLLTEPAARASFQAARRLSEFFQRAALDVPLKQT